jgi:hypothetical protein
MSIEQIFDTDRLLFQFPSSLGSNLFPLYLIATKKMLFLHVHFLFFETFCFSDKNTLQSLRASDVTPVRPHMLSKNGTSQGKKRQQDINKVRQNDWIDSFFNVEVKI